MGDQNKNDTPIPLCVQLIFYLNKRKKKASTISETILCNLLINIIFLPPPCSPPPPARLISVDLSVASSSRWSHQYKDIKHFSYTHYKCTLVTQKQMIS